MHGPTGYQMLLIAAERASHAMAHARRVPDSPTAVFVQSVRVAVRKDMFEFEDAAYAGLASLGYCFAPTSSEEMH